MRKLAALLICIFLCGACAIAQLEPVEPEPEIEGPPSNELFGGYTYERADLAGSAANTFGAVTRDSTGMSGFGISFSHYTRFFNGHGGLMLEVSRVSNGSVDPTGIKYSRLRFMAGPTYRLRRYGFFTPSIHALAGVDRATFTVPSGATSLRFRDTDLAIVGGGTLDGNLSRHLAVRLVQFDYVYTRHYDVSQSSFRYMGGVVLRF